LIPLLLVRTDRLHLLYAAILGRIVGGLLCGNLGVVKSFLTEVTDDTNRSAAFYLFSLSWTAGAILAPLIGGLLCKPAEKYPSIFPSGPGSIWVEFPYLLPCLLTVGISVFGAVLCMIFMIETRGMKKDTKDNNVLMTSTQQNELHSSSEMDSLEEGLELGTTAYRIVENSEARGGTEIEERDSECTGSDSSDDISDSADLDPDLSQDPEEMCCPTLFSYMAELSTCLSCTTHTRGLGSDMDSSNRGLIEPDDTTTTTTTTITTTTTSSSKLTTAAVLTQRVVVLATMNYGMLCASCILIDETLPLYLKLDSQHGGFGFSSTQIGTLLSTGAAGMTALSVVFMPLTNKMSSKLLSMVSIALSVPFCLAFPVIALLNNDAEAETMWLEWQLTMPEY